MEQIKRRSLCRAFFGASYIGETPILCNTWVRGKNHVDYIILYSDWSHKKQRERNVVQMWAAVCGEERCVTTLKTAARETSIIRESPRYIMNLLISHMVQRFWEETEFCNLLKFILWVNQHSSIFNSMLRTENRYLDAKLIVSWISIFLGWHLSFTAVFWDLTQCLSQS